MAALENKKTTIWPEVHGQFIHVIYYEEALYIELNIGLQTAYDTTERAFSMHYYLYWPCEMVLLYNS